MLGFSDFSAKLKATLQGRVANLVVLNKFDPGIVKYAGRGTVLIISDKWLAVNAGKKEVKMLIKTFVEAGSMIYVAGPKAGLLLKILDEVGVERFPRIPKEVLSGIGYMKISNNHDIIVYGGVWTALKTVTETLEMSTASRISPSQCEKVREFKFDNDDFGTGEPYGDVTVLVTICKIKESVSNYDWYWYYTRFQTVPEYVVYNSGWETAHEYLYHKVWNPGTSRWLWDYDPTTTTAYNGGTVTVTISVGVPEAGFSYSESYPISWLAILDRSNFNTHEANWEANFNEQNDPVDTGPSTNVVVLRYTFIVETLPHTCSFVDAKYGVMWGKPILWWWEYKTFWTNTKYLDLCPGP